MINSTEMFVTINSDKENCVPIDVEGSYRKYEDDPAYEPNSGNAMTCTYRPETTYELNEVDIDLGDVEECLKKLGGKDVEVSLEYEYTTYTYKDKKCFPSHKTHKVTSTVIKASDYKLIKKFIYEEAFDIVNDMVEYEGDM
jgi:copper chaperone CopZ